MRLLRYLILFCIAVIGGSVSAQSQIELGQLMRDRNEYYFTLSVNDPSEIQAISNICSVDGTDGRTVVAYANQREYDRLLQAGYQPNLQTPPSLREEAVMWDGNRATYEWDSYPTYSQYKSMMQAFPASAVSGRTCTYMELGTLSSGRKIMGVRINNGNPEGKPKFLYSSTIHGDETTGWILMLRLIDELCTSTDSRIVNLVDSLDIFIFPNTNPDGTYAGGNNTVTGARRANGNGVDMNRNYPDPHGSAHPDGNAYQMETQWFMQLAEDYPFVMAANYHGGAQVVNYPWDNTYTRHADDAWWQYVSREYAQLCQAVSPSYMTGQNNGITNGADWYMIGGGRQDYMNGYRQCREVTVECSTTKCPAASTLPKYWNYNHNAMLTYMEQCLNGVHGFVYDADTNLPLDGVTVTVQGHDDEYSFVSTHDAGDFHRPIKGGNWTITISKEGYCSQTLEVNVSDNQRVDLDVYLYPIGNCPPQPIQQMTTLHQGWNWWSTNLDITLSDFETALGTSGINILSQGNGSVDYMYNAWEGDFSELDFAKMYEVNVAELVEITLSGVAIDPTQLTITLNPNWNWIGYPVQTSMEVNSALSDFSPAIGDIIKSKDSGVSMYTGSSWIGVLDSLQPGQGYMYYSNATGTKTFTYPVNGRGSAKANVRSESNHWKPVSDRFANNMTVLAVVNLEGNEAVDESIEVGAFVGDECRGSVRLVRMDATGRYMAFMTVHGENGEQVNFKVLDGDVEREVRETLEFRVNGIFGGLNAPYVMHVGGSSLVPFPNPVERGKDINLDMPAGSELNDVKVEVYNTLGSLVRSEILNGVATLNGLPTAGVYTVKVTEGNGNVHFAKLVVR